jgi:DNA-binding response OmpR family regulator
MDRRPTALVVDDDQALRLLCRINLELEGFHVLEAASIPETVAALDTTRPDVVFLDIHLGHEGSEAILARVRGEGIPVVVVTGSADIDDYRAGADEVLAKPFLPDDLVAAARRLARVAE